tara:strand:- start:81 stop:575 length:495 start_codon:yes stop_codon:yes gene_type:complete
VGGVGANLARSIKLKLEPNAKLAQSMHLDIRRRNVAGKSKIITGALEAIADFDLENLMSFQKSKDDITDLTKKMYPDYDYEADAKGAFGMDHKGYISEVGSDILDMYFAKNSTLDDVSGMAAMDGGVDYLSPILKELEGKGFSKDQIFEIFTNNGAYVPNDELF